MGNSRVAECDFFHPRFDNGTAVEKAGVPLIEMFVACFRRVEFVEQTDLGENGVWELLLSKIDAPHSLLKLGVVVG